MSRKITYSFDTPYAGESPRGVIEVPDDATDEQINEVVGEIFFGQFNYGWADWQEGDGDVDD